MIRIFLDSFWFEAYTTISFLKHCQFVFVIECHAQNLYCTHHLKSHKLILFMEKKTLFLQLNYQARFIACSTLNDANSCRVVAKDILDPLKNTPSLKK
jgi:hypothetical protein